MRETPTVAIGDRRVGAGEPVLIIAEEGDNHDGDVRRALLLAEAARAAGADAVKFQAFAADRLASREAPKAEYQLATTDAAESQQDMLRALELRADDLRAIAAHCAELGILFLSSVFDEESADTLEAIDVPAYKLGSGEITNWPLLEHVARKGRPIILSTGMSELAEVGAALAAIENANDVPVILLQCVSNYPAAPADANLRTIATLREAFGVPVGYSDHTTGPETAHAAVALGACVLEKHLTLHRASPGPDHRASVEPDELARLVRAVRIVESALGDGVKRIAASERDNVATVRRSLAAAQDLAPGSILTHKLLIALRPGTGISPTRVDEIVGRRVVRPVARYELLQPDDVE